MAKDFVLPQLGLSMEEATVVAWLVQDGDTVSEGQEVVEVLTDKATTALAAPASGQIRLVAPPEAVVQVGGVLATIAEDGEAVAPAPAAPGPVAAPQEAPVRVQATPGVRRLARELGVNLATVRGSGPGGRVKAADVQAAAAARPVTPVPQPASQPVAPVPQPVAPVPQPVAPAPGADYTEIPISGVRRMIAQNLRRSLTQAAQVTASMEVDCTQLFYVKSALKDRGRMVSFNDVIARILIKTLRNHRRFNGTVIGDVIREYRAVHLGIAVDLNGSLVVAVVRDADRMNLLEFADAARDIVTRARAGKLRPDETTGSTFTISNTGSYPIDAFTPILNPPEIALLGLGGIQDKVYAVNGRPEVRKGVTANVTYDHCVVDGVAVAKFMTELKQRLESAMAELSGEVT